MFRLGNAHGRYVLGLLCLILAISAIAIPSISTKVDDWKVLDLGVFRISIPKDWKYKEVEGEDSFIGYILGPGVDFSFDYSDHGYANSLIQTEAEYLKNEEWLRGCPLYKPGIIYTANFNVANEKARQMKEKGITDSSLVKVEGDPCFNAKKQINKPTPTQSIKYPTADYIGVLIYRGDTTNVPVVIPRKIKKQNFKIDTTEKYIVKTIWTKKASDGLTGIFVRSRKSSFNFKMSAYNLSAKDQELALKSFKTIVFTDK